MVEKYIVWYRLSSIQNGNCYEPISLRWNWFVCSSAKQIQVSNFLYPYFMHPSILRGHKLSTYFYKNDVSSGCRNSNFCCWYIRGNVEKVFVVFRRHRLDQCPSFVSNQYCFSEGHCKKGSLRWTFAALFDFAPQISLRKPQFSCQTLGQ